MHLTATILLIPSLAAAIPHIHARVANPLPSQQLMDEVQIESVSTSGSGCPKNDVSTSISDDKTVLTLGFDEFQSYIGGGHSASDGDKECDVRLDLKYPQGYTYAVVESTFHGFAQLDDGITGTFGASFSFSDGSKTSSISSKLSGGDSMVTGNTFTEDQTIPTSEVVRSPCGEDVYLTIIIHISLADDGSHPNATGVITDDDATFALTQEVHLDWEKGDNSTCG